MNVIDEKTARVFKTWTSKKDQLESVKSDKNRIEIELANAIVELGQYLCPKNAKIQEIFSIWIDGKFLNIQVLNNMQSDFKIYWRKE